MNTISNTGRCKEPGCTNDSKVGELLCEQHLREKWLIEYLAGNSPGIIRKESSPERKHQSSSR